MVAPEAAAENLIAIIGQLEAKRAELQTERNALQAYLVPTHPSVVQISQQLAAIERQIAGEQAKLAAPAGMTLNRTVEELQRLQLEAEFQKEVYKSTLAALEKGRIEATRTLKKLSVLQAPNLPEYPLQPRRIYNVVVFTLLAYLVAGVLMLLIAAIRDHQD
jgi:capsular polysaccharide transport system permease protein